MIDFKINGVAVSVESGTTILEAAKKAGVHIPSLCNLDLHNISSAYTCGMCAVDIEGHEDLIFACNTTVLPGMDVSTCTKRAIDARRASVERILSNHPQDCLACARNLTCELQSLTTEMGVREAKASDQREKFEKDTSSNSIVRDPGKCIQCNRCEVICRDVQTVGTFCKIPSGDKTIISTASNKPLCETECTYCGQCVAVCPTGALVEMDDTAKVWDALHDPEKFVVVQTAPAIRVSLGEAFGMPPGSCVTGQMTTALRYLGFDKVLDTAFGADMTVIEESAEFLHRLEHGGTLPIITSCCPAWVKFAEHQYPDSLDMLSSCK
ncbi:MAG: 2Fe-2S iron-sulfur cluster-binding protein, partial [Defluviitaleaceae bacterium]|nr:2Fe-2S iron-sulfur cluster-binding protein [Defluviitaleaceae bacterium]